MPTNFVSPGVYIIEKDISEYTPSVNTSIVGIVGFASKGKTNTPTLITNQNNLIRKFGKPSESIYGQALEGALEILEETNSLYFVRAITDSAADASSTISLGTVPHISLANSGLGVSASVWLKIQVKDNSGVAKFASPKTFAILSGTRPTGTPQGEAVRAVIGGGLDSDFVGAFYDADTETSGFVVGAFAGSGASLLVSAYENASFSVGVALLQGHNGMTSNVSGALVSSIAVNGATFANTGGSALTYEINSLYEGAGYNLGTTIGGDVSGNSITIRSLGGPNSILDINEDGAVKESFKISLLNSGIFVEDVINTGEIDVTTEDIKGNLYFGKQDFAATKIVNFIDRINGLGYTGSVGGNAGTGALSGNPRFTKFIDSTYSLTGGDNGLSDLSLANTALIGDGSVEPKTGMQGLDDDSLNIGIALIPGIYNQSVQNALITLAESTQNFLALVSPPEGIGNAQNAIDWSNGKSNSTAGARSSAINNSYAAIYFPHVKVFSVFDGTDRWYDPTIFAARQMAFTDSVAASWFAPAGELRGRLTKPSDVEVKLNQGDRDSLYSGGNVINPIVSFPQQGITIFGQRTSQRAPSSLDRINVRRLMIYVRKVLLASTRRFVFEPNDEFTWVQIEGIVNPFLDDIRRQRGITEFRVVCDETVNTPVRVDRNELWCRVLIKPTKTAEIIIFELNLTNQSAQLGNL